MVLIFLICSHILLNKFIRTSIMTLWTSIIILYPYISIYGRKYPASLALCAFLSNNKTGSLYFEINLTSPYCDFYKYVSCIDRMKHWFFVIFNNIKLYLSQKLNWGSSCRSENMKIFFVNINYFHQFFRFFDISFLHRN